MTALVTGLRAQTASRDDEGHRTYTLTWRVSCDDYDDGPQVVFLASGLPAVGSTYALGNDVDLWAFCTPEMTITPAPDIDEGDPVRYWDVQQTFTTKPMYRCNTATIENPLLEPYQLSGDFHHESKEALVDRFGRPLLYSNYERMQGPAVENKVSYPTISITFNSSTLPLSTYSLLINNVNDATLWSFPRRTVRFADARWERLVYGTCFYYFKTTYTFEINLDTFDPRITQEGYKTLINGGNPSNPTHYEIHKDRQEETMIVLLDENGNALADGASPVVVVKEIAKEGNLLLLGIPSSL